MLRQRSTLAVARDKRPHLLPRGVLPLFVLLVLAALGLMYPYTTLLDRILNDTRGDELTVGYLNAMLRTDPHNPELRLRLARQWLSRNDFAAARRVLMPLLADDVPRRIEARMLLWEVAEQEWRRLAADDTRRDSVRRALLQELHELARLPVSEVDRFELARRALELGDRALALTIYRNSANGALPVDWFAEQSRSYLAAGEYEAAAEVLMIARRRELRPLAARRLYFEAEGVMRQSGRVADALALAERELRGLANDPEVLEYLTRLALAAGRPDIASKYARQMLKLSLLQQLERAAWARLWGDVQLRLATAEVEPATGNGTRGEPQLPFDDRRYTLGYEVFLANRELDEAWRVAASAVRQAPDNAAWRLRLAQVSEWSGRPQEALRHWRWLAEHGENGEATDALLRLAPGLFDDEALILGLRQRVAERPGDDRLLGALVDAYERIGDPEAAIAYLREISRRRPERAVLQALADIAERAADLPLAIATLRDMDARFGADVARAFKRSGFHLLRGELRAAYDALEAARDQALASDVSYWRRLGNIAQLLQRDDTAEAAYARMIGAGIASANDYDVLIDLLAAEEPARAADLAVQAWRHFPAPDRLLRALDLYAAAGAWPAFGRVLGELDAAALASAQADPRFLRLRARYLRETGQGAAALADLRQLLVLTPQDAEAREAFLWQLIDRRDTSTLRRVLAKHEAIWARDPALHDVLAAAWMALSLPRVALDRYLAPRAATHRGDFLWMMNLADAYEQDQQAERAWRLRAAAWRNRSMPAANADVVPEAARRAAWVRLANVLKPGDPALAALRGLLRLDREAGAALNPASRELVLAWYQDQGLPESVRGYLWSAYARHEQLPLWADMAAAINEGDMARAAALQDRWGGAVSRYEQITVARSRGDDALAATIAFDAQGEQRDDEALQLQLAEVLPTQANRAELQASAADYGRFGAGSWRERETTLAGATQLTPSLRLNLVAGDTARSVSDSSVDVPDTRYGALGLAWRTRDGVVKLELGSYAAAEHWTGLRASQSGRLFANADFGWKLAWREPATETLALRALGWRDVVGAEAGWAIDARDRVSLQLEWSRYATQTAQTLGYGRLLSLNFSHAIRQQSRDLFAEAFATRYRTSNADVQASGLAAAVPIASLLPQGYDLLGLRLRSDTRFATDYSRSWRPYGSLGVSWNSTSGVGFDASAGLAGSVLGGDHAAIDFRREQGQTASISSTTVLGMRYWIDF